LLISLLVPKVGLSEFSLKVCLLIIISRYRSITPKARVIPLSFSFLEYLRSDGIVLPSDDYSHHTSLSDIDNDTLLDATSPTTETADEEPDPSLAWAELHCTIKATIAELGGSVVPKLNWSAPKDATWISATNSMECRYPNDIYLLLKSSDFITHDLEHAFDNCEDQSQSESQIETRHQIQNEIGNENEAENFGTNLGDPCQPPSRSLNCPLTTSDGFLYCLVLRKTIPAMTTSLEFRCFVRGRQLLCICQRDLNHYGFLAPLVPTLLPLIQNFFDTSLKVTFPDENFVFDVYIPPPHARVWLIDFNPWAPRTDPLLFSWLEILEMTQRDQEETTMEGQFDGSDADNEDEDVEVTSQFIPEFRLVGRNDPEAYNFNTSQYSAHKLPKDVVDASLEGEAGLRDFMGQWREIVAAQERHDEIED
jgi:hypothetical protein